MFNNGEYPQKIYAMSYLRLLKTKKLPDSTRWIVKWDIDDNLVREVKLIYDPEHYKTFLSARKLKTQEEIIKILENDKEKRQQVQLQ